MKYEKAIKFFEKYFGREVKSIRKINRKGLIAYKINKYYDIYDIKGKFYVPYGHNFKDIKRNIYTKTINPIVILNNDFTIGGYISYDNKVKSFRIKDGNIYYPNGKKIGKGKFIEYANTNQGRVLRFLLDDGRTLVTLGGKILFFKKEKPHRKISFGYRSVAIVDGKKDKLIKIIIKDRLF